MLKFEFFQVTIFLIIMADVTKQIRMYDYRTNDLMASTNKKHERKEKTKEREKEKERERWEEINRLNTVRENIHPNLICWCCLRS